MRNFSFSVFFFLSETFFCYFFEYFKFIINLIKWLFVLTTQLLCEFHNLQDLHYCPLKLWRGADGFKNLCVMKTCWYSRKHILHARRFLNWRFIMIKIYLWRKKNIIFNLAEKSAACSFFSKYRNPIRS